MTATRPFSMPQEESRRVVTVKFRSGKAAEIDVRGLDDGRDIAMNREATPVEGNSVSLTDQMIGNIGRFEQKQ